MDVHMKWCKVFSTMKVLLDMNLANSLAGKFCRSCFLSKLIVTTNHIFVTHTKKIVLQRFNSCCKSFKNILYGFKSSIIANQKIWYLKASSHGKFCSGEELYFFLTGEISN